MSSIEPTRTAPESPSLTRPVAGVRDAIVAAGARFMTAFRAGDAAAVAACYTRDAQLLPANSDAVAGTAAITAFWRDIIAAGIADVRLETIDVESQGDLAVEQGRYALTGADGGPVDEGKYLVLWHRDGGEWKLHRDIWTTSRPAPGGA